MTTGMLKYQMYAGSETAFSGEFLDRPSFHLLLITLIGIIVYSNTMYVPFQWDEDPFIADNPIVKDLNYFFVPSKAKALSGLEQYGAYKNRFIGYFTFALNYRIHGLDVAGYHIFNTGIHILNSFLVYFLVRLLLKTPFLIISRLSRHSGYLALFASLFFVSHPVQTEAVTYIFQRLASLVTFFYLSSLAAYIKSRLSQRNYGRHIFYVVSLITAMLAVKTKENAFTLPLLITFCELSFFNGRAIKRILLLFPLLLTMLIVPLTLTGIDRPVGEILHGLPVTDNRTPSYFFTQMRVVATYLRLLLFPINQNIYYDYPVSRSFFEPQVFLSFFFLAAIICSGLCLFYRSRLLTGHHMNGAACEGDCPLPYAHYRLISFGILWFFITISVESSIVPIPMMIDEYRVYLPSAGAFIAAMSGVFLLYDRLAGKKVAALIFIMLIASVIAFSAAAYARNSLWRSGITLWEDSAKKSPRNAIVRSNLGYAYYFEGRPDKAIEQFQISVKLSPDYAEGHNNLGAVYKNIGMIDDAIRHFQAATRLNPDYAAAHFNLGVSFLQKGDADRAQTELEAALSLRPDRVKTRQLLEAIQNNDWKKYFK